VNLTRLKLMRAAARVGRMHTVPTLRPQSTGEHTFGVIAILFEVGGDLVTPSVVQAALVHDAPEAITGDVPAPAKWMYKEVENALRGAETDIDNRYQLAVTLTPKEIELIKFADLLELVIYSLEELDMGNKQMAVMAWNALQAINKRSLHRVTVEAVELYNTVVQSYYEKAGTAKPIVDTWHGTPLVIKGDDK